MVLPKFDLEELGPAEEHPRTCEQNKVPESNQGQENQ